MLYSDNLLDERNGRPIEGASVWVYNSVGKEAVLTDVLGQPLSQPLLTGIDGEYEYTTLEVVYRTDFWKNSVKIYTINSVYIDNDNVRNYSSSVLFSAQPITNQWSILNGRLYSWRLGDQTLTPDAIKSDYYTLVFGAWVPQNITKQFTDFLPSPYAGTDVSAAIIAAAQWSSAYSQFVEFNGEFNINNTPTITVDDVRFDFQNVKFNVRDDGTKGTLLNGAQAPFGMFFKSSPRLTIKSTQCEFAGVAALGTTRLIGMYFDHCVDMDVGKGIHFSQVSIGMGAGWSSGKIGYITGNGIFGVQPFSGVGTAGSLFNAVGCYDLLMEGGDSKNNYKPVIYASVALNAALQTLDNRNCAFGVWSGTGYADGGTYSEESSLISLRSAKNCTIEQGLGLNFCRLINLQRYATDGPNAGTGQPGFSCDGNHIKAGPGTTVESSGSGDIALSVLSENVATVPVGKNKITGCLRVIAAADCEYNIAVQSGDIEIESADIRNSFRGILTQDCILRIGTLTVADVSREAALFGNGSKVTIDNLYVDSGPKTTGWPGLGAISTVASGVSTLPPSVDINNIHYREGAGIFPYVYMVFTSALGHSSIRVGNINGRGTQEQLRYGGGFFDLVDGRLSGTAAPVIGTSHLDEIIYLKNPTTGTATQIRCSRGGTNDVFATTGSVDIAINARKVTFAAIAGRAVGEYFTIAGVSGIKRILAINGSVVTVDIACNATVTGAAIANALPIYRTEGIAQVVRAAASLTTYTAPTGGAVVDNESRASLTQMKALHDDLRAKLLAANLQS